MPNYMYLATCTRRPCLATDNSSMSLFRNGKSIGKFGLVILTVDTTLKFSTEC